MVKKKDNLTIFCQAIQEHEGYFPVCKDFPRGSRSFRNKNPGNLKYTSLIKELGAMGKDPQGFAIFETYEAGFIALKNFVKMACENRLRVYRMTMSILQFFETYAPSSDNNNPKRYAEFVAKKVGLQITDPIAKLI